MLNGRRPGFCVVKLDQRTGIQKVARQESTFPTLGYNLGGHRSRNLRKPPSDFLQTRGRSGIGLLPFDPVDVVGVQVRSHRSGSGFDYAHNHMLLLDQI